MIIDPSGRGPTMRQLLVAGLAGLVVFALVLGFLFLRYQGKFQDKVNVTANLGTTGDGLPADADVKFRGILVGAVKKVSVAEEGKLQQVRIEMKPEFAGDIPASVTARVVPSNLFAVTSVELVYNGPDTKGLREGSIIEEDRSKGTLALQDTLTTVRNILRSIDPMQFGRVLGTLSYALDGSARMPGSSVERVDRWLLAVDESIPNLGTMLGDFSASFHALNQSAPELLGVLGDSVKTARTIADRRTQLVNLITGAGATVDRVNDLFARNPDIGKEVTGGLSNTFGALSADPGAITRAISNLNTSTRALNTTFHWGPQRQHVWNAGITFSPWKPYTAADCPRYGELAGPSCATAPAVADPGYLPESMKPRRLQSAEGLPVLPPIPGLPDILGLAQENPAPAAGAPVNPFAGTPLEGIFPLLVPGAAPPPPAPPQAPPPGADQPAAQTTPAPGARPVSGPVTYTDDAALVALLGRRPTTVEYLLLRAGLEGGSLQVTESGTGR